MPIEEPPQFEHFTARMMEIASTQAPWHRRLWRSGTLHIARELLDESVRPGVPDSSIADQRKYVSRVLTTDPGISKGYRHQVKRAVDAISSGITQESHGWIRLREHLTRIDDDYLANWASLFDSPRPDPDLDVEGAARRITAHILDAGMHKSSLFAWLRALQSSPEQLSIGELIREADSRLKSPARTYTFCVPFEKVGALRFGHDSHWLTAQQTREWKSRHAPAAPGASQQGSLLLKIPASDVNAAADEARVQLSHLAAKFSLGSSKRIVFGASMWSKEKHSPFPTHATNRLINLRSFERLGKLQDLAVPAYIANAVALVQPLQTAPPHLAIMSGWAAIESLMVGPHDQNDAVAAERFALIVASSMVRAELTRLSIIYADRKSDELSSILAGCSTNLERARRFQSHLATGVDVDLGSPVDNLAVARIRPAITYPSQEVEKISSILAREFTRLYRKRNLVAHGGTTAEGNLHSVSETLTPLIGAGIDRIIHVGLTFGVPPIELSAIAESRVPNLTSASADDPGNLLDMLEFKQRA